MSDTDESCEAPARDVRVEDHAPADYVEALAQESIRLQRQTLLVFQSALRVLEQIHATQKEVNE